MELSLQGEIHEDPEDLQLSHSSRRLLMNSLNHITDFDSTIQQALDENHEAIGRTYTYLATHERLLQETRRDQENIRRNFQEMQAVFNQAENRIEKYLEALREDKGRLESRQKNLKHLSERHRHNTNDFMRVIVNEDVTPLDSRKRPVERSKASIMNLLSDPEEDMGTPSAAPSQKRPRLEGPDGIAHSNEDAISPQQKPGMGGSSFRLVSKPGPTTSTSSTPNPDIRMMRPSHPHSTAFMRSSGSTSPRSSASSMPIETSPRPHSLNPRASFRVKVTEAARPHEFKPYDVSNATDKKSTESQLEPRDVRTCRGCKQLGRRKDGKCIEKWGPGPEGAGTLCGRCQRNYKAKRH